MRSFLFFYYKSLYNRSTKSRSITPEDAKVSEPLEKKLSHDTLKAKLIFTMEIS